jgi:glycosyltransferase involved in cell wall biosynthesis
MGCGVVVASTPVGSVTDIVIDGETGFLLDDHNTAEMLSCYDRIQSRNDMAAISTAARDSVRDTYSKRAAQDRFTEITSIIATM